MCLNWGTRAIGCSEAIVHENGFAHLSLSLSFFFDRQQQGAEKVRTEKVGSRLEVRERKTMRQSSALGGKNDDGDRKAV